MENVDAKLIGLLDAKLKEYNDYLDLLNSVEIMSDNKLFSFYLKKKKAIENIVLGYKKYIAIENEIKLNQEIEEIESNLVEKQKIEVVNANLTEEKQATLQNLKLLLLNKSENLYQKVKIEISSKEENIIKNLSQVFKNFANVHNFIINIIDENGSGLVFEIEGNNAYELLKYFSGTHQMILNGRSTQALVVILDEKIINTDIKEEDVEIKTSKSSGAGGQHINKTESAIKLIHIPTGITCECQDERSQLKNKERAFENLKIKLLQNGKEINEKYINNQRKSLKTVIFNETPVVIYDYDKHKFICNLTKKDYELQAIVDGYTDIVASELKLKHQG